MRGLERGGRAPAVRDVMAERSKPPGSTIVTLMPRSLTSPASAWLKNIVDAGEIFHPLRWTPQDAVRFLQDVEAMERAGLVIRMPANWRRRCLVAAPSPQRQACRNASRSALIVFVCVVGAGQRSPRRCRSGPMARSSIPSSCRSKRSCGAPARTSAGCSKADVPFAPMLLTRSGLPDDVGVDDRQPSRSRGLDCVAGCARCGLVFNFFHCHFSRASFLICAP